MKKITKIKRTSRCFGIMVYPESMPENWMEILEKYNNIPMAVSPLHDRDGWGKFQFFNIDKKLQEQMEKDMVFIDKNYYSIDKKDKEKGVYVDARGNEYKVFVSPNGVEKIQEKPHYHLLLTFKCSVTDDKPREILEKLGGNGYIEALSERQAIDYYNDFLGHKKGKTRRQGQNGIVHISKF